MKNNKKIYVTQPSLPDINEYIVYLMDIWESKWLTNKGKYHRELEAKIAEFLGVKYVSLFTNGTLALVSALQVLRITGEVITTPFSFVATTHALHWNSIKPVFVDIDPDYCNLDPEKIEAAITPNTTAILPVHVYGNPCKVYEIQEIADTYGLQIIYDACHAFSVEIDGQSILNFGNLSVLSFHATKTFNTMEGGAIICHDEKTKKRIDYLRNFGFANETTVVAPGINAKMNEMQAALGLLQLKSYEKYRQMRESIAEYYYNELSNISGIRFLKPKENVKYNYPYFPIFVNKDKYGISRDDLFNAFIEKNIIARRYFYPLISQFPTYKGLDSARKGNLSVAEKATEEVICIPIYSDLKMDDIQRIIGIIRENHRI